MTADTFFLHAVSKNCHRWRAKKTHPDIVPQANYINAVRELYAFIGSIYDFLPHIWASVMIRQDEDHIKVLLLKIFMFSLPIFAWWLDRSSALIQVTIREKMKCWKFYKQAAVVCFFPFPPARNWFFEIQWHESIFFWFRHWFKFPRICHRESTSSQQYCSSEALRSVLRSSGYSTTNPHSSLLWQAKGRLPPSPFHELVEHGRVNDSSVDSIQWLESWHGVSRIITIIKWFSVFDFLLEATICLRWFL